MAKNKIISQRDSLKILSATKYRGKHLVIIKNRVFAAKTGQEAAKIFKEVIKKYPKEKPTIAYVPKEEMLILTCFHHGD